MLHLASQSPRRRELLARLGLPFTLVDVTVPEVRAPDEAAADYVRRVAADKACAGLQRLGSADAWVLGADTEVVLDDAVFGKPRDADDAAAMLRRLSGRTHQVVSTVVLAGADALHEATSVSEVTFGALDDATIAAYVASGEPEGKAGAYAIQGVAQAFIAHLSGSYSGVMGLPLYETARLLRAAGLLAPDHAIGAAA
ncbi:MAG TPA: Maf family nucleotide pyrophosphatase [Xanthomonadaceae bacterium]|nr:Maf family nucleotide pyrophosphatase [Xanthomonadaceae bacterium]